MEQQKFLNFLKGRITEGVVRCLLENSGYYVAPLGVEAIIPRLKEIDISEYRNLNLDNGLRKLPDFWVADFQSGKNWIVEVKYRNEWSDRVKSDLHKRLLEQTSYWNNIVLIIFIGNSCAPANYQPSARHFNLCVQILRSGSDLQVIKNSTRIDWNDLNTSDYSTIQHQFDRIQDVFQLLKSSESFSESTIIKSINLITKLSEL